MSSSTPRPHEAQTSSKPCAGHPTTLADIVAEVSLLRRQRHRLHRRRPHQRRRFCPGSCPRSPPRSSLGCSKAAGPRRPPRRRGCSGPTTSWRTRPSTTRTGAAPGCARWKYGIPPVNNANFACVQHFLHHLGPAGVAGLPTARDARRGGGNETAGGTSCPARPCARARRSDAVVQETQCARATGTGGLLRFS